MHNNNKCLRHKITFNNNKYLRYMIMHNNRHIIMHNKYKYLRHINICYYYALLLLITNI